MKTQSALAFANLVFGYDDTKVLCDISSELAPGDIYALFGPNGSGKSTLLKCLAGLLKPQYGKIYICGQEQQALSPREMSRRLAYVPQEHPLSFPFSALEIVLMGRTPHLGGVRGPSQADLEAAQAALCQIGIEPLAARPYTQLSGGQRQLVMIARALAQDTPIVILDEPTSALDFKNQIRVWETLALLKAQGKTVIVCTHDPNHVLWFCDQALVLKDGQLIRQGRASEIMEQELLKSLYGEICEISGNTVKPVRRRNENA